VRGRVSVKPIENLGFQALMALEHLGRMAQFGVRIVAALMVRPYRARRFLADVFDAGVLSLPVVCLTGVVVGGTLTQLGYTTLVRFGAQ
jgi:ABC-type transporter Mla maintaining outer membrane lipid asymmetry permease subunit MlaE